MIISEVTKPNQLKAKSKKPKLIKPNKGHESRNVTRGKLVGEAELSEKATIPVSGYKDAYDFIHDFWFYGHNPAEMVSWDGPRSNPTWFGVEEPKHKNLSKFLDDNGMDPMKLYNDELKVVLWLAKKMNISPMTVLRYGNDAIRFQTNTIKAVKQKVANNKIKKEADEPKADVSARAKLDHSLRAQGHKVVPDKKKEFKKGKVKHKGKIEEGPLVLNRDSDLRGMLDTLLKSWLAKGDRSDKEYAELLKALGYKMQKDGQRTTLVKAVQGSIQD